ncbi:MAG: hypothetical protein ACYC46_03000 [Acidobacteriaceae bacterium]
MKAHGVAPDEPLCRDSLNEFAVPSHGRGRSNPLAKTASPFILDVESTWKDSWINNLSNIQKKNGYYHTA